MFTGDAKWCKMSPKAATPSVFSILQYSNSVEFQQKWSQHFRGYAFWKSEKIGFEFFRIFSFFQFSKCMCSEVLWPFSIKHQCIEGLVGTINWWSYSFRSHFTPLCITCEHGHFFYFSMMGNHDCWPCSDVKIFKIEKSTEAVTTSVCSNLEYFNSVEFQRK